MKKREIWMPVAVALFVLLFWEICVHVFQIPMYLLPAPTSIAQALVENHEVLFSHAMVTLLEAVLGLLIALVLAVITAILMDLSKTFRNSIYPHLVVTQTVPVMVLAPLFSIWPRFRNGTEDHDRHLYVLLSDHCLFCGRTIPGKSETNQPVKKFSGVHISDLHNGQDSFRRQQSFFGIESISHILYRRSHRR